jgi:hypothetical protein
LKEPALPDRESGGLTSGAGLWPDVATARLFLRGLAGSEWTEDEQALLHRVSPQALARWCVRCGLAPLAYRRCAGIFPALAESLAESYFRSAGDNILRFHELSQILNRFRAAGIPVVALKGAALAEMAYGGIALRPMGDVDLWLRDADMPAAVAIMRELGFREHTKADRPPALQSLAGGEVQFYGRYGLVELHRSPFAGWWLHWTAAVDDESIWARTEPLVLDGGRSPGEEGWARQLAAEDMMIQVAVHMAVNHQFGMVAVRGLMDAALTARARPLDWGTIARLARRWRVATAVWAALDLAQQLIGLAGVEEALSPLRPSALRRVLLGRLVSPESVLAGRDLRSGRLRYLVLLLLVDRPTDAARLVFRSLWPEREWLAARYGEGWSRRRHLWNVVRRGEV